MNFENEECQALMVLKAVCVCVPGLCSREGQIRAQQRDIQWQAEARGALKTSLVLLLTAPGMIPVSAPLTCLRLDAGWGSRFSCGGGRVPRLGKEAKLVTHYVPAIAFQLFI